MRRRPLLATLATGSIGTVTGCHALAGPITQQSFEICDSDCDWATQTPDAGDDPVVDRYPDGPDIIVFGNMYVGSSSCDKAVLDSAGVREDTLHLVVAVGDQNPTMGGCTADMGTDQYRASFRFREKLPEHIVVTERAAYDPDRSETETDDTA